MPAGDGPRPLDYSREPDPNRSPWRRLKKLPLVVLAAFGVLLAGLVISVLSWVIPLENRLASARAHAAVLQQKVAGDARFENVWFSEFTRGGGTLQIAGYVDSTADLASLTQIVNNSKPPVTVLWSVEDLSKRRRVGASPATASAATVPARNTGDRHDSSR